MTSNIGRLNRRRVLLLGAGATLAGLAPRPAAAIVRLDVTQGNVQPIPIALPDFVGTGSDPQTAHDVTQIIAFNLQRSGLFLPIDSTCNEPDPRLYDVAAPRFRAGANDMLLREAPDADLAPKIKRLLKRRRPKS